MFSFRGLGELLREGQIVPTHDAVLDESFTTFRDLLFVLLGLEELAGIAD